MLSSYPGTSVVCTTCKYAVGLTIVGHLTGIMSFLDHMPSNLGLCYETGVGIKTSPVD